MTRYLSQALQDLVSDEPPIGITVTDVVNRGKRHQRKRRRWLLAALIAALLPIPPAGLGVAGAMSDGRPSPPRPTVSPTASGRGGSAAPHATQAITPAGSAPSAQNPPPAASTSARPPAANQIADPSFEAVPTGWAKFNNDPTTVFTPTDAARTGARALTITTTATVNDVGGATSGPAHLVTRAGATYHASCWVRAPVKVDAIVQVQEYFPQPDKSWKRGGDPKKSQIFLTEAQRWYLVETTYTAQHTGAILPLVIFSSWLRAGYSSLTVDDCSLVIVD